MPSRSPLLGQRDAERGADDPGQLQERLGAGERAGAQRLDDVVLDQRVERDLGQRVRDRADEHRDEATATLNSTAPSTQAAAAMAVETMITQLRLGHLQPGADGGAEEVADAGRADHPAELDGRRRGRAPSTRRRTPGRW